MRSAGRQAQRAGERLEHLQRGADVAALLEPRVPGGAHAGEVGDLLAAQPGRAAAAAAGEAHILGLEVRAALAQEVGQLGPAALAVGADDLRGRQRGASESDGGNLYYQDNSFSCTWISMIAEYRP